jgi:hypothetical protein
MTPNEPNVCKYTCGADAATCGEPEFSLPVELRFALGPSRLEQTSFGVEGGPGEDGGGRGQSWQDTLNGLSSAPLTSYVKGPDRSIILAMPKGIRDTAPGSEIKAISIRTLSTGYQTISITESDRPVTLPNADCHDTVEYQYLGDRSFAEDKIEIRRRVVELPPPARTVRPYGAAIFAGGTFAGALSRSHLSGVDELPNALGGTVGGSVSYRRWNSPVGLEAHLTWTITNRAYYPAAAPGAPVTHDSVTYQRFAFMPIFTVLPWHGFLLGIGGGAVLSLPTAKADFRLVGASQFSPIATAIARVRLGGGFWAEASTQLIPVEKYFKFESDFAGSPTVAKELVATGQFTMGMRYEFPVLLTRPY